MVSGFGVISVYILITGLPVFIITHYLNTKVANAVQKARKGLVVAIIRMRVIMNPACLVVHEVSGHNQYDSKRQKPILEVVPHLFGDKEDDASIENENGHLAVMVPAVAMPKRIGADGESKKDHEIFKSYIINQFDA
jgi:hypothetical protein